MQKQKCSFEDHKNIDAIKYCPQCNIYLCNKCENLHSGLCKNHHIFPLEKDIDELFTGYSKEKSHSNILLNYFCKDHNILCCIGCIAKIKTRENGKHHDCNVCDINDICDEKKKNLSNNIKSLENLSNKFKLLKNDLEKSMEEIDKNKEEIKGEIKKVFTKIRE